MSKRLRADALKTPTTAAVALIANAWGRDSRPILRKLDKPVLYAIRPENKDMGEDLKARVPHARVEVFENAGHMLFLEEPDRFNALLDEFVQAAHRRP
jgi:microsomal epoxide hydrolase